MLKNIFEAIDEPSQQSINIAQELVESQALLAGLGAHCANYPIPESFPVERDLKRAVYLLTSQEMWDDAIKSGQDQYFNDIRTEAVDAYPAGYDKKELRERKGLLKNKTGALYDYLNPVFAETIKNHDIVEHLYSHNSQSYDKNEIAFAMEKSFCDILAIFIADIVKAGFFGGLEKWPSANHYYNCLITGGYPTGWVGEPPESGGLAVDCTQLLHYGPQLKS